MSSWPTLSPHHREDLNDTVTDFLRDWCGQAWRDPRMGSRWLSLRHILWTLTDVGSDVLSAQLPVIVLATLHCDVNGRVKQKGLWSLNHRTMYSYF